MATTATRVYNADEVTIMIGGSLIDSGYSDGAFLKIEEMSDKVQSVAGTDGEVAISRVRDHRATVTLTLMQTSAGNAIMDAKFKLAKAGIGSPAIGEFHVRDMNGGSLYAAPHCWIVKGPDVEFDRSATAREWHLGVDNLERDDLGNNAA
jgi:hypothetical protein